MTSKLLNLLRVVGISHMIVIYDSEHTYTYTANNYGDNNSTISPFIDSCVVAYLNVVDVYIEDFGEAFKYIKNIVKIYWNRPLNQHTPRDQYIPTIRYHHKQLRCNRKGIGLRMKDSR